MISAPSRFDKDCIPPFKLLTKKLPAKRLNASTAVSTIKLTVLNGLRLRFCFASSITVKDGKITDCEFLSYEKDGTLKGEDYGKIDGVIKNAGLYKIAQDAIKNAEKYGSKLVETQQLDKVDAIAGATASYELFENVVGIALKQAKAE